MFEKEIKKALKSATNLTTIPLETPKELDHGDFSFPCFILSKRLKQKPTEIAIDLKNKIGPIKGILKIENIGPYLNFFVDTASLAKDVLTKVLDNKDAFGSLKNQEKTYMLEFFHANTHKGVHVGHIRNICLGESIARLFENQGISVIRTNYQGDIGPHVTKCLWGYKNGYLGKEPKTKRGVWLGNIYAEANKKITGNDELEDEIRTLTKSLYEGNKELTSLWKKTRDWCLEDFEQMYKQFHIKFDRLYFESEVEQSGRKIVEKMKQAGIAEESDGALIVNLKKYKLGIFVVLRSDGMPLYSTKDLALAEIKSKEYKFDRSIHVVGKEQELYFKQLFKTFELIKSPMAKKSYHLIYELVMLPEGKMSSREGNVIWYEDLIERLINISLSEVKKRHKDWDDEKIKETANKIAFGALKFSMINRDNNKALVFDWDKAMDFEGETGPYIQYSYARIQSILRKNEETIPKTADFTLLRKHEERRLINMLSQFPESVASATRQMKPIIIARYILDLTQSFSEYYHKYQILKEDKPLRDARLLLISSVAQIIKNGMNLLAIELPEQM